MALNVLADSAYKFHDSLADAIANGFEYILIPKNLQLSESVRLAGTEQFVRANIVTGANLAASAIVPSFEYNGTESAFNVTGSDLTVSFTNVNIKAENGTAFSFDGAATGNTVTLTGGTLTAQTEVGGNTENNTLTKN